MSILTRVIHALGSEPRIYPAMERRDALGGIGVPNYQVNKAQWPTRDVATYEREGYAKLALIFRCVGVISNAVASAPIAIYDTGEDPERKLSDHPLAQLIRRPNLMMGRNRFMAHVAMTATVTGFCLVEKERAGNGRPVGLWPLRSDWARPIPRSMKAPDWEYRIPGRDPVVIASEDVLVFTYADTPDGRYTGMGALEVALREVGILNAMTDFTKALFDRGAVPMYGLVPNDTLGKLDQDKANAIRQKFMQRMGLANAAEPAILEGIKDVKKLGLDLNELAYVDLRDVGELAICTAFGVPGPMVGQRFALERNTFTNYPEARRSFYEDTIGPLWERLDDVFTFGLLPEFDVNPNRELRFDKTDVLALQDDVTPTWTRAGKAYVEGWARLNETRAEAGLEALDPAIGDKFRFELMPQPAAFGALPDASAADRGIDWSTVQVVEGTYADRITPLPAGRCTLTRLSPEARARAAEKAKDAYDRLGAAGAKPLRAFFRDQGQRITAKAKRFRELPRWATTPESAESWNRSMINLELGLNPYAEPEFLERRDIAAIDWDDEEERLAEVLKKIQSTATRAGWTVSNAQLPSASPWDVTNPYIEAVLDQTATRITEISATTAADVRGVVGTALEEGVSLDEMAERLSTLFEETYYNRAETIARTESALSYNLGTVAAGKASGVVTYAELLDNPDHSESYDATDGLTCAQRDGLIVPLDSIQPHIEAEHPNGSLTTVLIVDDPDDE